ncbi:hypothetical protein [Streptomyces sp. TRM 70361]
MYGSRSSALTPCSSAVRSSVVLGAWGRRHVLGKAPDGSGAVAPRP